MKPVLVLALGRPTFDVPFAEDYAARAFAALDAAGFATIGPRGLLFDAGAAREAIAGVAPADISAVLLLQVTFTDASMTVEIAKAYPGLPLGIWAFPEPRAGGRLRLNSFCGLNLAAHALGRAGIAHCALYAPTNAGNLAQDLRRLTTVAPMLAAKLRQPLTSPEAKARAEALSVKLSGARIGLVGEHPAGFDTCRYEPARLASLAGASVETIPLSEMFARARAVDSAHTAPRLDEARKTYAGLADVDAEQLRKSLTLHAALDELKAEKSLDAFAVRCWPETFTEYGCAICGPMGMMGEAGTPCACEADVMGALTTLLLSEAAGEPGWLVDIVDMDEASDTGVFWHCGSAPLSMRDPKVGARAQIHSNRKMPLLAEFTLKPGRITIARLTQARNGLALVLGAGDVISAPMAFTGTSATVRFDGGVAQARDVLIGEMLEHHVAMVYGDHRATLEAWAALKGLPVMDLTS
ncbi:MAG: L-fucose/L-arabinose isomerase family protein [Rhabdaerophilum sp.]